jgi:hypothetical protein
MFKALIKERDSLEVKVYGVVCLGRGMIEDKMIDKKKEKDFIERIDKLEENTTLMMMWPIRGSTRYGIQSKMKICHVNYRTQCFGCLQCNALAGKDFVCNIHH